MPKSISTVWYETEKIIDILVAHTPRGEEHAETIRKFATGFRAMTPVGFAAEILAFRLEHPFVFPASMSSKEICSLVDRLYEGQ